MSMETDCIYGYGVKIYASDNNLADFIINHRDSLKDIEGAQEIINFIKEKREAGLPLDELKERFFWYEPLFSSDTGLYGIIADTIYLEEGIRVEYRVPAEDDKVKDDVILFPESYPWSLKEREISLTKETLDSIYEKYAEELKINEKPDFIRLEYFG